MQPNSSSNVSTTVLSMCLCICNCKQIATAMCIPHIAWTVYLHIMIRTVYNCTAAHICTLYSIFTRRYDTGTSDDDVNGKPHSIQVNQNDEFLCVVSSQHWAYSWLAYPLYSTHCPAHGLFTHCPASAFCKFAETRGRTSSCAHNISYSKTGL